ncbi:hypothetical protein AM588_10011406 [Phytophthora nicotianae]|uniref:BRCT domain-containing protein n=1 Tax=Phytophthora nicotianae TaxID=4792 RepID=A0A0W8DJ97_PHYNI|nr:hypothetical protein AM588_10011406 [Phytophthora nicotianae]
MQQRNERFVALVRPEWVFRTFLLQRLLPVDRFNPNPAFVFSTLAISGGTMGKDARKVTNGLITHFGGQIVDQKEVYPGATHILHQEDSSKDTMEPEEQDFQKLLQLTFSKADLARSVDAWRLHMSTHEADSSYTLPSCVVAYMGQRAGLDKQHHVKYTWIEECVMRQSRVPEGPFAYKPTGAAEIKPGKKGRSWKTQPEVHLEDLNLSKCAQVYQLGRTELGTDLSVVRRLSNEKLEAMKKTLHGAIVLLAQHIAPLLREKLSDMLKTVDAKVANVPFGDSYQDIVGKVVTNASFVVCRYRGGFEYNEAMRQGKKVVSIYWVLAGLSQVSKPTAYNEAIQRPVKSFGSIPGMQSFVITLSGYSSKSSPTREELQIAIHATGACLLPVLSRAHSTHLLCYEASGEKYKKALSWRFDNVLSHEWILKPSYLETCSTAGKFLEEAAHEWGTHKSDKKDIDARIWPEVCAYWRKERAGGHPGAFNGWRFFIHAKCVPPRDMCERIVLAGGGSVIQLTKSVDFDSLSKESTPEAPVVALFPPEVPTRDLWLKKIKTHDIECIKATFLIDYITKKQSPPAKRADYRL